jgi:signal peptidase I
MSLIDAAVFFAVAWGIWRRQWWAAVAGAYLLLLPVLLMALRNRDAGSMVRLAVVGAVLMVAAFLMLRTAAALRTSSAGGRGWPWLTGIGLTLTAALCLQPMVLPTESMADTLQAGDRFLIDSVSYKLVHAPERGDLVVFRYPPDPRRTFVKRVVGVPGDRIRIVEKVLYRNGVAVTEPYARHSTDYVDNYRDRFPSAPNVVLAAGAERMLSQHVQGGEVVVPQGHYFVLGDNRDNSLDSRYWGFIPPELVIGRPFLLYGSSAPGRSWPKFLTRS